MTHMLVTQLRFARSELVRCLDGVSDGDARRRLMPMNCISWMVGHLADQENRYWVIQAQGKDAAPGLNDRVGSGKPASTPPLGEMWNAWRAVTAAADVYLDTLTPALLDSHFERGGGPRPDNVGTMLLRNLYHYWFHIGEANAVRQMLGHQNVPQFVGSLVSVQYQPE
jgi:hypothetical protein